eukprot:6597966-Lingulodinium_polyedra.AAC.1
MPRRAEKVAQALLRDAPPEQRHAWASADWRRPGFLDAEIAAAEQRLKGAAARARERRGQGWHQWVQEALADGGGRLYKWIKAGGHPNPGMVPDP